MPFPLPRHTRHAATLPFSDNAVSFVKVRVLDGNIRTADWDAVTYYDAKQVLIYK
jgi:hypothetical protein